MVVLAAPRACFMIEKLSTLYGSPSNSIVMPFLISDVSTATANDDEVLADAEGRGVDTNGARGTKAATLVVVPRTSRHVEIFMLYSRNFLPSAILFCKRRLVMRSDSALFEHEGWERG